MNALIVVIVLFLCAGAVTADVTPGVASVVRESQAQENAFELSEFMGRKKITPFFQDNKSLGVSQMTVNRRSPKNPNHFEFETGLSFTLRVTSGTGRIFILGKSPEVLNPGDVLVVSPKTPFAVEPVGSSFSYTTVTTPQWYPEQDHIVNGQLQVVAAWFNCWSRKSDETKKLFFAEVHSCKQTAKSTCSMVPDKLLVDNCDRKFDLK